VISLKRLISILILNKYNLSKPVNTRYLSVITRGIKKLLVTVKIYTVYTDIRLKTWLDNKALYVKKAITS